MDHKCSLGPLICIKGIHNAEYLINIDVKRGSVEET